MSAPKSTASKTEGKSSSIAEFKKRKKGQPLELPSGLVVVARRVELRSFLNRGEVPNPLLEIVDEALNKGKKADVGKMIGVEEGKIDLDLVNDMYAMVNDIVIETVVEPKVHPEPDDESDRDDDELYVDEIDDEDKMFLFQWATGGTSDLASFRAEAAADLASLAQGQVPGNASKRAAGAKKR